MICRGNSALPSKRLPRCCVPPVGSQCMEPLAYRRALALVADTMRRAGVTVDIIDVGGGFPVSYPDLEPPPLADYIAAIEAGAAALPAGVRLWAEPGRA